MRVFTVIINKKILFILIIFLSFTGCSEFDSNFLDYPVHSPLDFNDFWLITEHDIYIDFIRYTGYRDTKIGIVLRSKQPHKIFNIKELSYEFDDGTKGYFLENVKSKIPKMTYNRYEHDRWVGYYHSHGKRGNHYFVGKFKGEDLFKDNVEVGEEKEIKITLIYSFDYEQSVKTEIYNTFRVSCLEREKEEKYFW